LEEDIGAHICIFLVVIKVNETYFSFKRQE